VEDFEHTNELKLASSDGAPAPKPAVNVERVDDVLDNVERTPQSPGGGGLSIAPR
jgi:hypothetical protein